jgi:hypothetical protein
MRRQRRPFHELPVGSFNCAAGRLSFRDALERDGDNAKQSQRSASSFCWSDLGLGGSVEGEGSSCGERGGSTAKAMLVD